MVAAFVVCTPDAEAEPDDNEEMPLLDKLEDKLAEADDPGTAVVPLEAVTAEDAALVPTPVSEAAELCAFVLELDPADEEVPPNVTPFDIV